MKIAFLTDPLSDFKIAKDSTFAMMREADRRGHEIYAFGPGDMAYEQDRVVAQIQRVHLTIGAAQWYRCDAAKECRLDEVDVVVQRKDPPFDMEYVYATYLLELAELAGARVVNKPAAIRSHNEKLSIAQFAQFTVPTLVTRDEQRLRRFHEQHQTVILKPLDGMGGAGVFKVGPDGLNLGPVIEMLTGLGTRTIMAQRYIPEITQGDKRVLLIDGQAVPFALARIPQGNEIRGNLAAGGVGVAQPLTEREKAVATHLGPILAARGLLLVGLDMIGGYLTEVNVTSPTCFQEITQQTGFDVAAMFVDALERGQR